MVENQSRLNYLWHILGASELIRNGNERKNSDFPSTRHTHATVVTASAADVFHLENRFEFKPMQLSNLITLILLHIRSNRSSINCTVIFPWRDSIHFHVFVLCNDFMYIDKMRARWRGFIFRIWLPIVDLKVHLQMHIPNQVNDRPSRCGYDKSEMAKCDDPQGDRHAPLFAQLYSMVNRSEVTNLLFYRRHYDHHFIISSCFLFAMGNQRKEKRRRTQHHMPNNAHSDGSHLSVHINDANVS